jgi:hypothetical protein
MCNFKIIIVNEAIILTDMCYGVGDDRSRWKHVGYLLKGTINLTYLLFWYSFMCNNWVTWWNNELVKLVGIYCDTVNRRVSSTMK